MKKQFRARGRAFGVAVLIGVVAVVAAVLAGASASRAAGPASHPITVAPHVSGLERLGAAHHFGCQDATLASGNRCYQAFQMQAAYNLKPLLDQGINGAGKTIVIIDAYSSPSLQTDVDTFSLVMGIPDTTVQVIQPAGNVPTFNASDPNQFGWAIEISLDVQWAHAMAPGAKIVLAEAPSNNDADILAVTKYVIDNKIGDVISQSFGEAEACMDPSLVSQQHVLFQKAADEGISVFASSGDSGASQPACVGDGALLSASTPASDPNVTAVGGTTLLADGTTGAYQSETAWTESVWGCNPPAVNFPADVNCSGGGFSSLFGRPDFQASTFKGPSRGVPDVAYNAGVAGGVLTHIQFVNDAFGLPPNVFFIVGGTSAGSPQWAGLAADGDQLAGRSLGDINPALYAISNSKIQYSSALHDITTGNNNVVEIGGGYSAGAGWDPVTGLGSPNAANLLPQLVRRTS
jgi:subtilase family serine protease